MPKEEVICKVCYAEAQGDEDPQMQRALAESFSASLPPTWSETSIPGEDLEGVHSQGPAVEEIACHIGDMKNPSDDEAEYV